DGSNRTAEGKRRSYSKNKICEPARAWMRRPRGRSGRGLAALGADDGDERHALARGAAQVVRQRELPAPRHAGDLALAGLAAQLQPRLEQHAQARGPDRVAEGLEPTVRVHRQLASRSKVPFSTSFHAVPRGAKPRSSISTSSVGVKQSCTSAMASSARGSLMPAW